MRSEAAPFYPPLVKPARRPLRFPFNLIKLLHNNLELIPEAAYREPVVVAPGPPRMAFFTGAEMVKKLLLGRPADYPKGRLQVDILKPIFGNAMISAEAEEWRWQRAVAAPLFRHEELLRYGPVMTEAAEAAVARWRAAPAGYGPCHPFRHDAGRVSRHFQHDARRRCRRRARRHREGACRLLPRRQLVGDLYAPRPAALAAATGRQGDAGARSAPAGRRGATGQGAPKGCASAARTCSRGWRALRIPAPARAWRTKTSSTTSSPS